MRQPAPVEVNSVPEPSTRATQKEQSGNGEVAEHVGEQHILRGQCKQVHHYCAVVERRGHEQKVLRPARGQDTQDSWSLGSGLIEVEVSWSANDPLMVF